VQSWCNSLEIGISEGSSRNQLGGREKWRSREVDKSQMTLGFVDWIKFGVYVMQNW
jgi:hypothetical protein